MRCLFRIGVLGLACLAAGCASPQLGEWSGPAAAADITATTWMFGEEKARVLRSPNYLIYTTIDDPETLELLPQVMEGALSMYRQVVPDLKTDDRPLECFIFKSRSEWDRYTQRYSGEDAETYLRIRSGGYTIGDRFVFYYLGRMSTFSVAAHEGWHQFAGRNFKGRLPPFLEEGLACMFETISWQQRLPRWNLSVNTARAQTLRSLMDSGGAMPLADLCAMHAGDIVGQDGAAIDAFYAQCWAFARFLWEGEGGRHRPALRRWLLATAEGTVYDPTGSHRRAGAPWNRKAVGPMLEHYLGMPLAEIDAAYRQFMRKIAYEELPAHWRWWHWRFGRRRGTNIASQVEDHDPCGGKPVISPGMCRASASATPFTTSPFSTTCAVMCETPTMVASNWSWKDRKMKWSGCWATFDRR